jgi:serine/threonine protein phosphatase 1
MPENAAVEVGERIYAIGDVHGRLDLFGDLIGRIRSDQAFRPPARVRVILLGDVIDRGPDSAELVRRLMAYTAASDRFVVLKGNHEEVMVEALEGGLDALQTWMGLGGAASLRSWGVPQELLAKPHPGRLMKAARRQVSDAELRWLEARPLTYSSGGYLFVHAGIRPGVPLAQQHSGNLLWIREPFLSWEGDMPAIVVHGHSARSNKPEIRAHRIGLDTGAYRTGRLTALGLEGERRWLLSTAGPDAMGVELP